jgi:hypothetical protein
MATWTVTTTGNATTNGTNFQTALNSCALGDDIVLQAGSTYAGNFTLPDKGAGTSYITIHTSGEAGLPPAGTRITTAYASVMPILQANSSVPALEGAANAHHYKLIGINITNVGGATVTQELVLIGNISSGSLTYAQHPHHITFDRCWIHEVTNDTSTPDSTTTTAIRGMDINATDITITECRIAGFRAYQPIPNGIEASNAILFPNSALRVLVHNCYLEAWFVPIFMGGSGGESANTATLTSPTYSGGTGSATFSSISNLAVGDLVAFKVTGGLTPPTNGVHPSESTQFQVAKVTGIAGSVVSYMSWGAYDGDVAGGNPLLQAPDAAGPAQWNGYLNEDITITQNDFVLNFNATEAVWVATGGDPTTSPRATQSNTGNAPKGFMEIKMARNVLIDGNTFDGWENGFVLTTRNQGNISTSGGFPWAGLYNVTISNNWWKRMTNWDRIYGFPFGGPALEDNEYTSVRSGPVTITNNLIESGVHNILSSMTGADNVTLTHNTYPGMTTSPGGSMIFGTGTYSSDFIFKDNILPNNEYGLNGQVGVGVSSTWPSLVQNHNVIIDNRSPDTVIGDGPLNSRYPNDFIATTHAAVGWTDEAGRNFRLASSSTYKNAASDGTDVGVNYTTLLAALGLSDTTPTTTSNTTFFTMLL